MSLRTALLPIVETCRALAGSTSLDIRTTQLTIRTRTWSGGRAGVGTPTDNDLVLPQRYKVIQLSAKDVASSGGRYEMEDLKVGPITPAQSGSGYTLAQLLPTGADGVEILYVLTGVTAGEYVLVQSNSTRPFRYELILRRRRRTP